MTASTPLQARIRQADPCTHDPFTSLDVDPDGPAATRIRGAARAPAANPGPRVRRPRVVATLAVLFTVAGTVAVASVTYQPDPADVQALLETFTQDPGQPQGPGLAFSSAWCAFESGVIIRSGGNQVPMDQPMTTDHLIEGCNDEAATRRANGELVAPATSYTLCEGRVPAEAVSTFLQQHEHQIVEGTIGSMRPWMPFLLGWDADCESTQLVTDPSIELSPLTNLDAINAARMIEIRTIATETRTCLTEDDVLALARDAVAQLEGGWIITDWANQGWRVGVACYTAPWIDPLIGHVSLAGRGG